MSLSIADIAEGDRIAVLSADGNNLGALFESLESLVELAKTTTAELLAVWPGKTRSDVFFLDDLDEAESVLRAAA